MPRRRWLTARRLVALAAGVGLLAACSSSHKAQSGSSTTTAVASSTTTTAPSPSFPPTTATTTTTAPGAAVPAGFSPRSVTFVSLQEGWVAGTVGCSAMCPVQVAHTTDSGHSWHLIAAPPVTMGPADGATGPEIRFATPRDGWVYGSEGIWSTHDAGAHWAKASQPAGLSGGPYDLEASAGVVYAVSMASNNFFQIESSPVASDAWRLTGASLPIGAGPVPEIQLILHGTSGWVVENDRIVTAGARLQSGHWSSWTPPCEAAGGKALVAASATGAVHLVAYCAKSGYVDSPPGSVGVYASSDGQTFGPPTATPASFGDFNASLASSSPTSITVGNETPDSHWQLEASFNGGHTWAAVTPEVAGMWNDLGFTSSTQGVAVELSPNSAPGALYMTYDGGHSWHKVLPA